MPGTLEAYYQEAGRAGRDGLPGECVLLHSFPDRFTHEFFIRSANPDRQLVEAVYRALSAAAAADGAVSIDTARIELMVPHSVYRFATKSGELRAMGLDNGFQLDFPATSTAPLAADDVRNTQVKGGASGLYQAGEDLLLELASTEAVQQFQPDLNAIRQLGCRGLIITAAGEKGVDFVSRFFAPAYGIDEDPVTGSAHCGLADYWHKRLGKHHFIAKQVSKRGGDLEVMLEGNRVLLVGQAITTLRASLAV
jgi:predicted PhzF superfamily epimerase YddE/YHI9